MKKVNVTGKMAIALVVLLLAVPLAGACAKPAPAPAPVPAPKPAPAPSPAAAPAPKPASKSSPLDAIIEGAKKEGAVTALLSSAFTPAEVTLALERAVKAKYGVDLKIKVAGGGTGQGPSLSTAILEYKTGTTPEFDMLGFSSPYALEATKSGAFEIVDWRPLVEPGTPPEMVPQQPGVRGSVIYLNSADGLVYNPDKIPAAEVPRKLADLLNPKWQGRLGIMNYSLYWTQWAFVLGKDTVFSLARSLVKMKPRIDEFIKLNNFYLVGEIDLAFANAAYVEVNRAKGKPTAFRSLDMIVMRDTHLLVRKGAKNVNAAKLLALFFISPEGVKFTKDQSGRGLAYFPGNLMYDTYQQGLKEGLKAVNEYTYPGMIDFANSPDYKKWQQEVELILQGG